MLELVVVVALVLVLCAVALPRVFASRERAQGLAASRYVAARMALARTQAAGRRASVALVFDEGPRGVAFRVHEDGNGNGVRTSDIRRRIDPPIGDAVSLSDLFPGVAIGVSPGVPLSDPLQIGASNILSFTPTGSATPGTIYVAGRDGTQWAVRVFGATGRVRVLRYEPGGNEWLPAY